MATGAPVVIKGGNVVVGPAATEPAAPVIRGGGGHASNMTVGVVGAAASPTRGLAANGASAAAPRPPLSPLGASRTAAAAAAIGNATAAKAPAVAATPARPAAAPAAAAAAAVNPMRTPQQQQQAPTQQQVPLMQDDYAANVRKWLREGTPDGKSENNYEISDVEDYNQVRKTTTPCYMFTQ